MGWKASAGLRLVLLAVALAFAVMAIGVGYTILIYNTTQRLTSSAVGSDLSVPPAYEVFMSEAEEVSASGLADLLQTQGAGLHLPTWMPPNIVLTAVCAKHGPFVAILTYSDRGIKDFRHTNVTIELTIGGSSPTPEQLKMNATGEVLKVGETWIVLHEKAHIGDPELDALYGPSPFAYFWYDGLYYMVGVKSPLSRNDILNIICSMSTDRSIGTVPGRTTNAISASDLVVRIFYNPNGFQVPLHSTLLPNGTVDLSMAVPPNYAIQIQSLKGGWLQSLYLEGQGYQKYLPDMGTIVGSGITIYPVMPKVWKAGDTIRVVVSISLDIEGPSTTLELGNIEVEGTNNAMP